MIPCFHNHHCPKSLNFGERRENRETHHRLRTIEDSFHPVIVPFILIDAKILLATNERRSWSNIDALEDMRRVLCKLE